MKAVILGSGGWGTALSLVLCANGHQVTLWSHNPAKAASLQQERENPLLKGVRLPETLHITGDMECLRDADMVVFAPPSYAMRSISAQAAPYLKESAVLVTVSKGVERDTNLRMSQIIRETTGDKCKVVALSGPSHAEEVATHMPTGCVAACEDEAAARMVQDAFIWYEHVYR